MADPNSRTSWYYVRVLRRAGRDARVSAIQPQGFLGGIAVGLVVTLLVRQFAPESQRQFLSTGSSVKALLMVGVIGLLWLFSLNLVMAPVRMHRDAEDDAKGAHDQLRRLRAQPVKAEHAAKLRTIADSVRRAIIAGQECNYGDGDGRDFNRRAFDSHFESDTPSLIAWDEGVRAAHFAVERFLTRLHLGVTEAGFSPRFMDGAERLIGNLTLARARSGQSDLPRPFDWQDAYHRAWLVWEPPGGSSRNGIPIFEDTPLDPEAVETGKARFEAFFEEAQHWTETRDVPAAEAARDARRAPLLLRLEWILCQEDFYGQCDRCRKPIA